MDAPTRLLLALLWLKVYPTWTVPGSLFAVEESMTRRSTRDVLAGLETRSRFPLERRTGRPRGRPLEQVVREFPAVAVRIDASEQLEKLEPGEGIGLDKGYTGIEAYHPEPCCYVPIKKPRGGELSPADR